MTPVEYMDRANQLETTIQHTDLLSKREQLRDELRDCTHKYLESLGVKVKSYALPVKEGRWRITQGNITSDSHQGYSNRFCWDFEIVDENGGYHPIYGKDHKRDPEGNYCYRQPIYAIASGRVVFYFRDKSNPSDDNMIIIHHRETPDSDYDQTRAIYIHMDDDAFLVGDFDLEKLARKYEGKYFNTNIDVKTGDKISEIGHTGTPYSHLHCGVKFKSDETGNISLPISFKEFWRINEGEEPNYVKDYHLRYGELFGYTLEEALNPSIP